MPQDVGHNLAGINGIGDLRGALDARQGENIFDKPVEPLRPGDHALQKILAFRIELVGVTLTDQAREIFDGPQRLADSEHSWSELSRILYSG